MLDVMLEEEDETRLAKGASVIKESQHNGFVETTFSLKEGTQEVLFVLPIALLFKHPIFFYALSHNVITAQCSLGSIPVFFPIKYQTEPQENNQTLRFHFVERNVTC